MGRTSLAKASNLDSLDWHISDSLFPLLSLFIMNFLLNLYTQDKFWVKIFISWIDVVLSQFGEVDIDSSLVASHSSVAEDIVMVNNGCLCCTVRGDLVKMLLKLVKEKREKFDHIVIETTGRDIGQSSGI